MRRWVHLMKMTGQKFGSCQTIRKSPLQRGSRHLSSWRGQWQWSAMWVWLNSGEHVVAPKARAAGDRDPELEGISSLCRSPVGVSAPQSKAADQCWWGLWDALTLLCRCLKSLRESGTSSEVLSGGLLSSVTGGCCRRPGTWSLPPSQLGLVSFLTFHRLCSTPTSFPAAVSIFEFQLWQVFQFLATIKLKPMWVPFHQLAWASLDQTAVSWVVGNCSQWPWKRLHVGEKLSRKLQDQVPMP